MTAIAETSRFKINFAVEYNTKPESAAKLAWTINQIARVLVNQYKGAITRRLGYITSHST
jgi:hypothetical protein